MGFGTFNGSVTNISVKEVGQDWGFTSIKLIGTNTFKNTATNGKLSQTETSIVGAKYRLSFTINSGSWNVVASTVDNTGGIIKQTGTTSNSGTIEFIATTTTTYILLYNIGASGTEASITNISLLQVTDDTDLPRINYEGFSYQDVLGSELVVNGDFATDSDWTKTQATISNGEANITSPDGSYAAIYQSGVVTSGKTYYYSVNVKSISGTMQFVAGSGTNIDVTTIGIKKGYITANGTSIFEIKRKSGAGAFAVTIDNVSVKEVTGQEVVPNSGCGSWLFEPQSTNLVTYSEDISNAYWTKLGSSTTSGFTSPSGVGNAYKLVENTSNGLHWMYSGGITVTNATKYNVSVFAKKGERNSIRIAEKSGIAVIVNLESKDFDTIGAGVINSNITELVDDWVRIDYSFQTTSTSEEVYIYAADNGNISYQGNGSSGIYVWGVQLEALSYTTSYIPTNGATSTRLQDLANNSGNSTLINSTEGVLYAEIAALANDGTFREISLNDGTTTNVVEIRYTNINNAFEFIVRNANTVQVASSFTLTDATQFNKIAFSYKTDDYKMYVNGVEVASDTSGTMPSGLNKLSFNWGGFNPFFGNTKALAVWKEALTDTELELLTAPTPEFPTFSLDFDTIAEQFTFARGSEATFVNEQGLIQSTASNDAPRIDYSTGVEAFLLEPQSTNLIPYSEDFSNWSNARTNDTANQANSPNGLNNGTLLEQQSGQTNAGSIYVGGLSLPSGTYTQSIFAKKKDKDFIVAYNTMAERTYFNLSNGTIGTVATGNVAKIEDYGNGWYRCEITYTTTTPGGVIAFYLADTDNSLVVTDSGGVYIWGGQLEQQSYATSYIPTSGASATRNQETCIDATPTINSKEGVLYAEISALAIGANHRYISLSDGTANNRFIIRYISGGGNQIGVFCRVGGATQFSLFKTMTDITNYSKVALKYGLNNFALWIDGVEIGADTTAIVPAKNTLNQISFEDATGGAYFYGNTKGLQLFDKALSDYQLKQLTTI